MHPLIEKLMQLGLDQNQALQMTSLFKTEVNLKKNDFWLKRNMTCQKFGFIIDGMCRLFYINDKGNEITRWVSIENDFITSLGSFIRKTNTNEYIQAITTSKILVAQKEEWDSFCNDHEFARVFWTRSMEEYLIGLEERVYSLIALNGENRYKYLKKSYPSLVLNVPDKYLASILGIQPRHLTRLRAGKK